MQISEKLIKDRSYATYTEPTQNLRYNRSSTRYSRYKSNEINNRYENDTDPENNKKTLIINAKCFEEVHITQDNKFIQTDVKEPKITFTLQRL